MVAFEPRCKVCRSNNRKAYEDLYLDSDKKMSWIDLEKHASTFHEEISWKAFSRHFERHFTEQVAELVQREEKVSEVVEGAKKEVIDIVGEIRNNLNGLKTLITNALQTYGDRPVSPQIIRGLTDLYREHRQSIEACERLMGKLTEGSTMSEAELLKVLYAFAKDFCPTCTAKFKDNLDAYLREKEYVKL